MCGVVKCCPGQRSASVLVVVGQPVSNAACFSASPPFRPGGILSPVPSFARGVGHPIVPVSDVRRTDARRRERDTPEGVTHGFQVSVYKVDPYIDVFARNLLSNDDCRLALRDEVPKSWPEVPLVSKPSALACRAERLARTGTGPNRSIVAPTGTPERKGPDADTGKKMALRELAEIVWLYIFNAPGVDHAGGDVAGRDQVAQPLGCIGVDFVVVGGHACAFSCCCATYRARGARSFASLNSGHG